MPEGLQPEVARVEANSSAYSIGPFQARGRDIALRNLSRNSREPSRETARSYVRLQRPLSCMQRLWAGCPLCSRPRRATHHKPRELQEPPGSHALDAFGTF